MIKISMTLFAIGTMILSSVGVNLGLGGTLGGSNVASTTNATVNTQVGANVPSSTLQLSTNNSTTLGL